MGDVGYWVQVVLFCEAVVSPVDRTKLAAHLVSNILGFSSIFIDAGNASGIIFPIASVIPTRNVYGYIARPSRICS